MDTFICIMHVCCIWAYLDILYGDVFVAYLMTPDVWPVAALRGFLPAVGDTFAGFTSYGGFLNGGSLWVVDFMDNPIYKWFKGIALDPKAPYHS